MIDEQNGTSQDPIASTTTTDPNPGQISIDAVLPENTTVSEPILEDNPNRFVLFPIQHDDIWAFYKKSEASFWTAEEIDLAADIVDWNIRVEYRYNARLGAWLSGENLLNRTNPLLFGYNSQGTRVTFGFNYAF